MLKCKQKIDTPLKKKKIKITYRKNVLFILQNATLFIHVKKNYPPLLLTHFFNYRLIHILYIYVIEFDRNV